MLTDPEDVYKPGTRWRFAPSPIEWRTPCCGWSPSPAYIEKHYGPLRGEVVTIGQADESITCHQCRYANRWPDGWFATDILHPVVGARLPVPYTWLHPLRG